MKFSYRKYEVQKRKVKLSLEFLTDLDTRPVGKTCCHTEQEEPTLKQYLKAVIKIILP